MSLGTLRRRSPSGVVPRGFGLGGEHAEPKETIMRISIMFENIIPRGIILRRGGSALVLALALVDALVLAPMGPLHEQPARLLLEEMPQRSPCDRSST